MSFNVEREVLLIAPEILNARSMPSVGVGYIASYLKNKGVAVRIHDAQFSKADSSKELRKLEPTLVGIAVESRTFRRALRLAQVAKRCGHTVLVGGLHVSLVKEEMLRSCDAIDYAIHGDGEVPVFQLVEALSGKRPFDRVSGLIWREGGEIRINENTTALKLDELPLPDYRLAGIENIPLYPLVTSRDCPFKCSFCTVGQLSHGRFRPQSAERAVSEIQIAKEHYGTKGFIVVDENFSFKKSRAMEFCQSLIDKKVNLPWTAFEGVRADALTEDFLDLLKASNCKWIFFGIETVENTVLREVQKGGKFKHVERAVKLARSYGFKVGGFLIVGLPGSTYETDCETLAWARTHLDKCTFWTAIPYYGTGMHDWVLENGRLLRPPVGSNLINTLSTNPFFETPDYPAKLRKRMHITSNICNGIDYFVDHLDFESWRRLKLSERTRSSSQRKMLKLAHRYCPDVLPYLRNEVLPPNDYKPQHMIPDINGAEEPLPRDLRGTRATPIRNAISEAAE
ncbi:MAG: radical SAM protein [Planctomycetota bacterium]